MGGSWGFAYSLPLIEKTFKLVKSVPFREALSLKYGFPYAGSYKGILLVTFFLRGLFCYLHIQHIFDVISMFIVHLQ